LQVSEHIPLNIRATKLLNLLWRRLKRGRRLGRLWRLLLRLLLLWRLLLWRWLQLL
jgi:hypothetical protein